MKWKNLSKGQKVALIATIISAVIGGIFLLIKDGCEPKKPIINIENTNENKIEIHLNDDNNPLTELIGRVYLNNEPSFKYIIPDEKKLLQLPYRKRTLQSGQRATVIFRMKKPLAVQQDLSTLC